ncbi:hypothetical protein M413DRAFT_442129 [Hebeloma cylindrosporum]|uniref:Uncharacterized protein n=1 Tax=Hebeloma cylindrosporum TaxID=76867 RepID=A0A0C3CNQ7_HEBCY|nr:hypothetical protein M413DRAFT_442129 [Hebeloma cylindrosporum h7]
MQFDVLNARNLFHKKRKVQIEGIRKQIFSNKGQQGAKTEGSSLYNPDPDLMTWTFRAPGQYFSKATHDLGMTMERI